MDGTHDTARRDPSSLMAEAGRMAAEFAGWRHRRSSPPDQVEARLAAIRARLLDWRHAYEGAGADCRAIMLERAGATQGETAAGDLLLGSFLFDLTGERHFLDLVLAASARCGGDPSERYNLWLNLDYLLFLNKQALPSAEYARLRREVMRPRLAELDRAYGDALGGRLPPLAGKGRAVLLTRLYRPPGDYAPLWDALEYATLLEDEFGIGCLIADAGLLNDSMPFACWPPGAFRPAAAAGLTTLRHHGRDFPLLRRGGPALDPDSGAAFFRAVAEWRPAFAIAFGDGNLVAEALASRLPTACLHYTVDWPVTLRCRPAVHHRVAEEEPAAGCRITPAFSLPEPRRPAPHRRGDHGLPSDAFVIAVVGHRLRSELDAEMLALLDRVLARHPEAWVAFVGTFHQSATVLARHSTLARRHVLTGPVEDLPSWLRLADCFVNPQRAGGGSSAAFALAMGLPVLTLPGGDVEWVVGEDEACPDRAALERALLDLAADPDRRASAARRASARFGRISDRRPNLHAILASLDQ